MKTYRTSGVRILILLIFGTIIAAFIAFSKANTASVFLGVEAIFILMAFAAWAYVGICFDGNDIVRTLFFLIDKRLSISSIQRVRFGSDEDGFGGRTTYVTIEFRGAKPFLLFDFLKSDLREIVDRISAIAPDTIDLTVTQYLSKETNSRNMVLRRGDKFLFISGAIVVLFAILWWLLQRFLIS